VSTDPADAQSIFTAMLQLDSVEADALRAGLSPEMRAAVDELDANLADREAALRGSPTLDVTEMNGAFWAAPVVPESTLGITEMYGAFWSAPPLPASTVGVSEMYGAFWSAPVSPE
jgi:hypothetical protein